MSEQAVLIAVQEQPVTPEQVLAIARQLGLFCLGCPVGDGYGPDDRGCGGFYKGLTSWVVANQVAKGKIPKEGYPCGPINARVEAVMIILNHR